MPSTVVNPNTVYAAQFLDDIAEAVRAEPLPISLIIIMGHCTEGIKHLAYVGRGLSAISLDTDIEKNVTNRLLAGLLEHLADAIESSGAPQLEDSPGAMHPAEDTELLALLTAGEVSFRDKVAPHLVRCSSCCRSLAEHIRKGWTLPPLRG